VSEERRRKLPRSAVKPLIDYCKKTVGEADGAAEALFGRYLELMRKYADFFFARPWPETLEECTLLTVEEDLDFAEAGDSYAQKCERATVARLRHAINLQGFDAECFERNDMPGSVPCWNCVVPDAMLLRKEIAENEQRLAKNEDDMKSTVPSWMTKRMHEFYGRPDVVRSDTMRLANLKLCEDIGGALGKSCEVKNKYRCPYGEASEQLIEDGELAKFVWHEIRWYDSHWNPCHTYIPVQVEMKWYHFNEPSIIDVTSYDDIIKALDDGRLERIIAEHEKYTDGTGQEA
jgi:hypothetical protein